jgi:hypothetical protein
VLVIEGEENDGPIDRRRLLTASVRRGTRQVDILNPIHSPINAPAPPSNTDEYENISSPQSPGIRLPIVEPTKTPIQMNDLGCIAPSSHSPHLTRLLRNPRHDLSSPGQTTAAG